MTVQKLCRGFLRWASGAYRAKSEVGNYNRVCDLLTEVAGGVRVVDFGPKRLKSVRERMIALGWCVRSINRQVGRIRFIFRWGVEEELVPVEVHTALCALRPLRRGTPGVVHRERVRAVDLDDVTATIPHLPEPVAAIVRLQLLTGARPGEARTIRAIDLRTAERPWVYVPDSHKTAHHGHERRILIGPRAQELLMGWMARRSLEEPLFQTRDGGRCGRAAAYTKDSYARAIARGCDAAGVKRWTANQLRHRVATDIRRTHGIEAARVILGHAHAVMTEHYAAPHTEAAVDAITRIG